MARQQATTDDLAKLRRSLKWEKDASTKRVNEVHEMTSMGKFEPTHRRCRYGHIAVDMLMRKMAHVELLKRSVDGQMQELMHRVISTKLKSKSKFRCRKRGTCRRAAAAIGDKSASKHEKAAST